MCVCVSVRDGLPGKLLCAVHVQVSGIITAMLTALMINNVSVPREGHRRNVYLQGFDRKNTRRNDSLRIPPPPSDCFSVSVSPFPLLLVLDYFRCALRERKLIPI